MNQRRRETIVNNRIGRRRTGFSIIEVLTSIVVAMIGVFGVMILIPFAVKQAQTGLDSDSSVTLGRNAYSQFEIWGYKAPTNWMVHRGSGIETAYSPFERADTTGDGSPDSPADPPSIFSIDPLGIGENGGTTVDDRYSKAWFPFNQFPAFPAPNTNLRIRPVNLRTPTNNVMDLANARRLMRTTDDLVFGESIDDLLGPEQLYDQAVDPGPPLRPFPVRRQFRGRLSWSAIVVPFKPYGVSDWTSETTQRWSYKMYILVYKDRPLLLPDPDGVMRSALVTNTDIQSPVSNVYLESSVTRVDGINRDDWVMLINRDDDAEPGFQRQLAFYRVVSASDAFSGTQASLTLDGPDFTFTDPSGTRAYGDTFVVHLKNVVGVYERTFEPEFESTWTVN